MSEQKTLTFSDIEGPKGIGGWLLLLGIGIAFSPLSNAADLLVGFKEIDGSMMSQLWAIGLQYWLYVVGLLVFGVLLFFASAYQAYIFFTTNPIFPKFFQWYLIVNIVFLAVYAALTDILYTPSDEVGEFKTLLFRSIIFAAIWIPYIRKSRRVRNTFVKHEENTDIATHVFK